MSGAGMAPGLLAFNQLLALAAENKAKDAAVNMYELMITKGPIDPDEKSFGAMINCAWVRAFAFCVIFAYKIVITPVAGMR